MMPPLMLLSGVANAYFAENLLESKPREAFCCGGGRVDPERREVRTAPS